MSIKKLSETIINQIAAGEVVERPASVVKELIENAIDAGATKIEIFTSSGGKGLIKVTDNGDGIKSDELGLAILRHCTSKMDDDIHNITHLGFRGEALPSIGSVAKLRLISKHKDAKTPYEIEINAGKISPIKFSSHNKGTTVEVRDLFYIIPARLKFMKSDKAENLAISQVVRNISIAHPNIHFVLSGTDRQKIEYINLPEHKSIQRINEVIDKNFSQHAIELRCSCDEISLKGYICTAQFDKGNNLSQYVYINNRPVRDKLILSAIRVAYSDVIPKDRHGVCVLFFTMPPHLVDVNVHPAKADVRFQSPNVIRSFIIHSIREALTQKGMQSSTNSSTAMLKSFAAPRFTSVNNKNFYSFTAHRQNSLDMPPKQISQNDQQSINEPTIKLVSQPNAIVMDTEEVSATTHYEEFPLGAARAQIHKNYIISQTLDSIIITDQHAAHERIVYEALKKALYNENITSQTLLIPEIVTLNEDQLQALLEQQTLLSRFGLIYESFGVESVVVRSIPAILGKIDVEKLIATIADKLLEDESNNVLEAKMNYIAATMACHGSIRSGRILTPYEMNELLRKMENTPSSSTCNHGRPTYIELKLSDIEKLFDRR